MTENEASQLKGSKLPNYVFKPINGPFRPLKTIIYLKAEPKHETV